MPTSYAVGQAPWETTSPSTAAPTSFPVGSAPWETNSAPSTTLPAARPVKDTPHPIRDILLPAASAVGSAFQGGVQQAKQGFDQARTATNPIDLLEGGLSTAAGVATAAASPLAPVTKPLEPIIGAAADKISDLPAVQKFAQSDAGAATSRIVQNVANADTVMGAVAGARTAPAEAAASLPGKVAEQLPSPYKTTSDLKASATADINKALSNTGKASATGLLNKDSNRLSGLETLYTMTKDQPVTRSDGSQFSFDPTHIENPTDVVSAFVQAKNQIWQRVQAGLDKGSSVAPDYSAVERQLQDVVRNSASKSLVAHAQSRLAELQTLKTQGVAGAQRYLQEELNPRIGAAITGASDAPALRLDAQLATDVNNALDNGLSKVQDAAIRPLKDMYSSLKSIEPDLVKMVQQTLRAKGKGLPQYINDFGNINLLEAAFAHNPAFFLAKAGGMKILAKVLATQRDPIDHLSNAFKSIQSYLGNAKPPAEAPTLALPPGIRGAPSRAGSGYKLSLPQRAQSTVDAAERANTGIKLPASDQAK